MLEHQDIDLQNIVVNFYCNEIFDDKPEILLIEHRRKSDVAYSFIDYDLALQCPKDAPLHRCMMPVDVAWVSVYMPLDLRFSPPYYNPFAYDVACLGNIFRYTFSVCTASTASSFSPSFRFIGTRTQISAPCAPL